MRYRKKQNTAEVKGFTLAELAVVLAVIGIVMVVTTKWFPALNKKNETLKYESEFKTAATSWLNSFIIHRQSDYLPAVSAVTPYPMIQGFEDRSGLPWGYLPAYDTTAQSGKGVCNRLMPGSITLRYCEDRTCTSYHDRTGIALLLFSGQKDLSYNTEYGPGGDTSLTEAVYRHSPLIVSLKANSAQGFTYDNNIAAYSYAELWDSLGCRDITATIPVSFNLPAARTGEPYSHTGMNFADTDGVKYCFTQDQPDSGLAINKIYFSDRCDETALWVEDKNHDVWILSGTAPKKAGMLYFTGYARISADNYTVKQRFALPVGQRAY